MARKAFRYWLLALLLCAAAVMVCMAYIDRPLAEFFNAHVRETSLWVWLSRALQPLDVAVVAALFFLLGCGVWVLSGRRLGPWTQEPLLCSWSAMWAVAAVIIFKQIFGRGEADPTYIQYHVYGFRFFHSGPHWEAFPSGTAAISTAIISPLWITTPSSRFIGPLVVALLSTVVVVMNFHWLSDVIAGVCLGASIGWSTVLLQGPSSISK
jgi:membrane-associated phospholipid phosphatase